MMKAAAGSRPLAPDPRHPHRGRRSIIVIRQRYAFLAPAIRSLFDGDEDVEVLVDRRQRERHDHRRAVNGGAERPHDAAEAMVEGDADADAVLLGKSLAIADVIRVEKNIAVREGSPFGETSRSRRVLNVDRVSRRKRCFARRQCRGGGAVGQREEIAPAPHAGSRLVGHGPRSSRRCKDCSQIGALTQMLCVTFFRCES